MTTISRAATRKIAAIKERATACVVHSLRNDFAGVSCEPRFAWDDLARYHNARLWVNDTGDVWTVHVHGNLWYRLTAAA
jgi:hypothetical protein